MTDSWWLKVKRAQKHMVDIHAEARRYAERHPYEFVRIRRPDRHNDVRYRTRITEQPDPRIALILGDFVHNLRSALDHVIVASVPRKERNSASFPIFFHDILAKDADGQFVVDDPKMRENFERSIRGLDPRARAIVIQAQPYHRGPEAHRWILGIISRLDNADKHRALVTVGSGVRNLVADVTIRGDTGKLPHHSFADNEFAKDDTVIGWELPAAWRDGGPKPCEVDMEYSGTAVIHVKVTGLRGNEPLSDFPLSLTVLGAMRDVRRMLRLLEPFAI